MARGKGDIWERKCHHCGKMFAPTAMWAYKWQDYMYCTWGCLRADERKREAAKKTKRQFVHH